MDDCKNLNKEDINPWHSDVFDHPSYKCTCKLTGRKVITYLHCNSSRCKDYESSENNVQVIRGQYAGGEYEYCDIKSYEECCGCAHFFDNWHEERFECFNIDRKEDDCYEVK